MSYLGIVLGAVFASNVLFVYGLGLCPAFHREGRSSFGSLVTLAATNLIAALLLWALRTLVLLPLHLEKLDIVLYALCVMPVIKYLARAVGGGAGAAVAIFAASAEDAVQSCLVFGIALIASRSGFGLLEALAATLASVLGYWAALVLLEAIRTRLELSELPGFFRGTPALLISAGLIAMAFMGVDAVLIKNLVG